MVLQTITIPSANSSLKPASILSKKCTKQGPLEVPLDAKVGPDQSGQRKAVPPEIAPHLEFSPIQESETSESFVDPDDSTYLPTCESVDTTNEQAPTKPVQDMDCSRLCKVHTFVKGTFLSVTQTCLHQSCLYAREWNSQPLLGSTPVGNFQLSAAVFYTGSSFVQTNKVLNAMHMKTITRMTHSNHVRNDILLSVLHKWRLHQTNLLDEMRQRESLCLGALQALHYNENSERTQARTAAGELRYQMRFPKAKRGEHVVSMVKTKYTTEYVTELMDLLFNEVVHDPAPFVAELLKVDVPAFLCSQYQRPEKAYAIAMHVSSLCVVMMTFSNPQINQKTQAFRVYGEDENNNVAPEEVTEEEATQDDGPDTEEMEVEVDFISVEDIMAEDNDGLHLSLKLNTALPASAACERLFSAAGLIFSPRRGQIDSHNFENQLLLKLNKDFLKFE
ncbi:uncharacterized protein LOC127500556 isoform X5 [Scomber scombrus]|uniref:Uncharacterized protein LOC127500556 isoform X5 n=1 Tax=Scomber scombrus TaxID=13677 RepID=A0AAV1QAI8_SCOSC